MHIYERSVSSCERYPSLLSFASTREMSFDVEISDIEEASSDNMDMDEDSDPKNSNTIFGSESEDDGCDSEVEILGNTIDITRPYTKGNP